ncbi:hypothetical protein AC1031_001371 [Aphanomyces cochlioides]|nr:hypothetical protein AC1031_001371 [Aphanomyces cochlioides]
MKVAAVASLLGSALFVLSVQAAECGEGAMPIIVGQRDPSRKPLAVNVTTYTTDCSNVSFVFSDTDGAETPGPPTTYPTCIWFPNGTVIRGGEICSKGRNNYSIGEFHVIRQSPVRVEAVQYLPSNASIIYLNGMGIRSLPKDLTKDDTGKSLVANRIHFENNSITSIQGIVWPPTMSILYRHPFQTGKFYLLFRRDLTNNSIIELGDLSANTNIKVFSVPRNQIKSLAKTRFPPWITDLYLQFNFLSSLENLPPVLDSLTVSSNLFTSFPSLPSTLTQLLAAFNRVTSIDRIAIPPNLQALDLSYNNITEIRANFPSSLSSLCLAGNPITAFYANQSQFELLSGLDNNSTVTNFTLGFDSFGNYDVTSTCAVFLTTKATNLTCKGHKGIQMLWNTFPICMLPDTVATSSTLPADSSSNKTLMWVGIGAGSLVVVVSVALFLFHVRRRRRHGSSDNSAFKAFEWHSPTAADDSEYSIPNDIRYDDSLKHFIIPASCVERERVLATGGNGIVYLARITRVGESPQLAALKRVLPSQSTNLDAIEMFMNELRLSAALSHPNIVTFLGFTWTTLSNLSVLSEYMSRGDLWSILDPKINPTCELEWLVDPNVDVDFDKIHVKSSAFKVPVSKFSVVCDVANALAYLHTLDQVVLHRDIKARNVFINNEWTAKLGDFGTSRARDMYAMTAEIGTLPWMAPEVLKGIMYNEKADIYSFGVLLSEVDLRVVPYSNVEAYATNDSVSVEMIRARVAMLVMSGDLRPKFSPNCPKSIVNIARRCLAFDPRERPSALEVVGWLNQLPRS